jgi:hypothetical protein
MHFRHRTFSRESIREHLGRFIVDRRSLILFGVDKIGLGFRMYSLKKVLILINEQMKSPVSNAMCLYHVRGSYDLVSSRVMLRFPGS